MLAFYWPLTSGEFVGVFLGVCWGSSFFSFILAFCFFPSFFFSPATFGSWGVHRGREGDMRGFLHSFDGYWKMPCPLFCPLPGCIPGIPSCVWGNSAEIYLLHLLELRYFVDCTVSLYILPTGRRIKFRSLLFIVCFKNSEEADFSEGTYYCCPCIFSFILWKGL